MYKAVALLAWKIKSVLPILYFDGVEKGFYTICLCFLVGFTNKLMISHLLILKLHLLIYFLNLAFDHLLLICYDMLICSLLGPFKTQVLLRIGVLSLCAGFFNWFSVIFFYFLCFFLHPNVWFVLCVFYVLRVYCLRLWVLIAKGMCLESSRFITFTSKLIASQLCAVSKLILLLLHVKHLP